MITRCKNLESMFRGGYFPSKNGQWIDGYNHITNDTIAGTILTTYDSGNLHFVTEVREYEEDN